LRVLWDSEYKQEPPPSRGRDSRSPDQEPPDYLASLLNEIALVSAIVRPRENTRRDQLKLYLEEPPNGNIAIMDYLRTLEKDWPQLASTAFDFIVIPAISSEYERVFSFSSCTKETTAESSRLTGRYSGIRSTSKTGSGRVQFAWKLLLEAYY
jgi:hypothetical protein